MISRVNNIKNYTVPFRASEKFKEEVERESDELLPSNPYIKAKIGGEKLQKAFSWYPIRGLNGNRNSNFYEFLTMGMVPYVFGSLTLISIFNSVKHFSHNSAYKASKIGNKVALGVILYGLFKSISKSFVTIPVKLKTGIDTEIPYRKVNLLLPNSANDKDLTSIEYHKVGESVDFTRWDLLYGDTKKGEARNYRYDKIAKKLGLGENLNDSDTEVKPIYREVLAKTKVAKSFSSYLWAGVGVMLAFQDAWKEYFNAATFKFWKYKDFGNSMAIFGKNFVKAWGELLSGGGKEKFIDRHAGKAFVGLAALSSVLGTLNALNITKKPSNVTENDVLDTNKGYITG